MPLRILNRVNFWLSSEITGEKLHEEIKSVFSQQHSYNRLFLWLVKHAQTSKLQMGPNFFYA